MPKEPNFLAELAAFGEARRITLRDPLLKDAFAEHVGSRLEAALGDPIRLYGQRVEEMFEALLIALGEVTLLKREDVGEIHAADDLKVPDYRVVLPTGEQWLVEVKNVYEEDPRAQQRLLMKRSYREALERYAAATGGELKLAVYWARWSIWTLVSPAKLIDAEGNLVLDMMEAIAANEFGHLGERTIGTKAPLTVRLDADPERMSPIADDGTVMITIGAAKILCDGQEIDDEREREIASILMEYGDWECDGPNAIVEGDRLKAIEFVWQPIEPTHRGFEFVGSLSRMFARYFARKTVSEGSIVQLRAPFRPNWFDPLVRGDIVGRTLPLWRFTMQARDPKDLAA